METLTFALKGNNYTTKPATIGSFIDLWKKRTSLSSGMYGSMYLMSLSATDKVLQAIDIEAFFHVFVPKFLEDLKVSDFKDLGIEDYNEIKEVYVKDCYKWLMDLEKLLVPEKK